MSADPHSGPVPDGAWAADDAARRVEMFNATRPGGLDGWTMDRTYTKVDLEARCEIERVPGSGAQRLRVPG